MKLIQIADLHINASTNIDEIKIKIEKLYNSLKNFLNLKEQIVFCVLGNIIDQGNYKHFDKAEEIFNYIKELFKNYKFEFEFVPGNHDLCECNHRSNLPEICKDNSCTLEYYNLFINKFLKHNYKYDNTSDIILREYENINLILVNSVYHLNCKFGKINIAKLQDITCEKNSLILTHHTLLSENDDDNSSIRNSYKLLKIIEAKKIIGFLHGHTHGYKNMKIGNDCLVIGVGPLFKQVNDVSNQINLIDIQGSYIQKIINFDYHSDLGTFDPINVYESNNNYYYTDNSIKEIYDKIVDDTKNLGSVINLKLNIKTSIKNFYNEIENYFSDNIKTAKEWQLKDVPNSMYYNHGQFMKSGDIWGIDYIIKELNNKATSSRAIIPLINFNDVVNSGDAFLPSFDIVQFGFNDDVKSELLISIYLRALEVNHFLKINLCEVYVMCKEINDKIRSINKINITFLAFRTQYKKNFGCFKKAKIDTVSEAKLTKLLMEKDKKEIIDMLNEKIYLHETVIQDKGLIKFKSALSEVIQDNLYSSKNMEYFDNILNELNNLKSERCKTSNYKNIEIYEKSLERYINEFINYFLNEE